MNDTRTFKKEAISLRRKADRRAKALGHRYSYGQLIADITAAERLEIVEAYRKRKCETVGGTRKPKKK